MSFFKRKRKDSTSPEQLKKAFEQAVQPAWTHDEVKDAIVLWVEALKRGNSIEIGNLYGRGAAFWGMTGDYVSKGALDTYHYFDDFLGNKQKFEIDVQPGAIRINGLYAAVSGDYTMRYADRAGQEHIVPARFAFTIERMPNGEFEIIQHHASLHPEKKPSVQPRKI